VYDCDICGRAAEIAYVVEIEGAMMTLCERCAKGKTPVRVLGEERMQKSTARKEPAARDEPEVVSDYGHRIRSARDAIGMSTKVLAEKINEKESTLIRVENQRMLPDETLRKKLERELGIKLMEQVPRGRTSAAGGSNTPTTLWDAAIRKEKKKQ
jgi:putative transcription factor